MISGLRGRGFHVVSMAARVYAPDGGSGWNAGESLPYHPAVATHRAGVVGRRREPPRPREGDSRAHDLGRNLNQIANRGQEALR